MLPFQRSRQYRHVSLAVFPSVRRKPVRWDRRGRYVWGRTLHTEPHQNLGGTYAASVSAPPYKQMSKVVLQHPAPKILFLLPQGGAPRANLAVRNRLLR